IHTSRSSAVFRITGIALGCIGFNDCIRCDRQEAIYEVRTRDGFRLGAAVASEFGPDTSEGEQRAVVIERKPHHVLFAGGWICLRRFLQATSIALRWFLPWRSGAVPSLTTGPCSRRGGPAWDRQAASRPGKVQVASRY